MTEPRNRSRGGHHQGGRDWGNARAGPRSLGAIVRTRTARLTSASVAGPCSGAASTDCSRLATCETRVQRRVRGLPLACPGSACLAALTPLPLPGPVTLHRAIRADPAARSRAGRTPLLHNSSPPTNTGRRGDPAAKRQGPDETGPVSGATGCTLSLGDVGSASASLPRSSHI